MYKKEVHKKGSKLGVESGDLTQTQSEVYHYIVNEFLTPKQIAIRRQTSVRAVYKILNILRKRGILNKDFLKVHKTQCTLAFSNKKLRLHGEEYNIKILYKDNRYRKQKNTQIIDGNTIRSYNNSIEIYSMQSFFGDTTNECEKKANKYWINFILKLEQKLKVILFKEGKKNIDRVNYHFSETNNELAKDYNKKSQKLRVKGTKDNKTWAMIDNSFNLNEFETIHPKDAKPDMDNIKKYFNDIRDNTPPTNTELTKHIKKICLLLEETSQQNKETAAGLNSVVSVLNLLVKKPPQKSSNSLKRADYIG